MDYGAGPASILHVMLLTLLAAAATTGYTLQVGEASMVPPEALPLGGYTARGDVKFQPGGDALRARTLIIRQGTSKVALVAVETLTMPESLVEAVRAKTPKDLSLWLVATHTHCAPDSSLYNSRMKFKIPGIASYSERWVNWAAGQISASIESARKAPEVKVASLATLVGERLLNRGRRKDAIPDPLVTRIADTAEVRPWLVVYSAHPTNYDEKELRLRGDWPGRIMDRSRGLGLTGAIGDASPAAPGATASAKADELARALLASSPRDRVASLATKGLAAAIAPIKLDPPKPHPNFAKDNKVPGPLAEMAVRAFAPPVAEVQALRLGSTLLVGVPGEPTTEVAQAIQQLPQAQAYRHVVVVSHVNGWVGYILMPADYDRGGYEATLSFNGRETASRVVSAAGVAITKLGSP
jgi:neutral ceramidase